MGSSKRALGADAAVTLPPPLPPPARRPATAIKALTPREGVAPPTRPPGMPSTPRSRTPRGGAAGGSGSDLLDALNRRIALAQQHDMSVGSAAGKSPASAGGAGAQRRRWGN